MRRFGFTVVAALMGLAACGADKDGRTPPPAAAEGPAVTATRNAYFGDLHVHTGNSFDAYIFDVRTTPDEAYAFAKGGAVKNAAGVTMQMSGPPLDFMAVTDHGEYLGVIPAMDDPASPLSKTETAKAAFGPNAANARDVFSRIGLSFVIGEPIADIYDHARMDSVWADAKAAADRHYAPGTFTTFAGYEFTAMKVISVEAGAAANLHRNVIFRDAAPDRLFTTLDSTNPEDLWAWMASERAAGRDALAIPHNSNASNGDMFALKTYSGEPISEAWAKLRQSNEPLVEITQVKGTSDTHPKFSPNDEWADFERFENFIGSPVKATINEGDYVRKALARGLGLEQAVGVNPYKFGLIGSSDTHNGAGSFDEAAFFGKFTPETTSAEARASIPPAGAKTWDGVPSPTGQLLNATQYSASGLAGVWAEANTREAIFDAMRRRETFGTSGPRMKVRFFGGADLTADMLNAPDLLEKTYAAGVPMGADLAAGTGKAPGFIAWGMRDPASAPLQRLQVIKVWEDGGSLKETVYDAACPGGALPDAKTFRCPDNGAFVDTATCQTAEGTAAAELKAFWTDPSFDPAQDAAYYVRVLENPTCRWSTWDAVRNGTPPRPGLPVTVQERAWSSPIWVTGN